MRLAPETWKNEAAMMAVFQAEAKAWGFRVYPESGGYDLLLEVTEATLERLADGRAVDDRRAPRVYHPFEAFRGNLEVGDVLAVEGKLRGSFEVLAQAMPRGAGGPQYVADSTRAADWYLVVIPRAPVGFEPVAEAIGVIVVECVPTTPGRYGRGDGGPGIQRMSAVGGHLRVVGYQRMPVPRLEVEMAAGQPAPRAITPWKIGAVELCLIAQHRPLTRADFRERQVRPESMTRSGWMACEGRGKEAAWTLTGRGLTHLEPAPTTTPDGIGAGEHRDGMVWRPLRPDVAYPEIVEALRRQGFDPVSAVAEPQRVCYEPPTPV